MRVKTWKALSKFLRIYIFILFVQVAFPKAAYAFLSSVDACAANPECAAVLGAELAPSVAAPTGAGSAATISVTSATGATTTMEAASGVAVVAGDMRLSGVAAYYIWGQLQNQQAQDLAKQKYCAANSNDAVCVPPFTGGQCLGVVYDVWVESAYSKTAPSGVAGHPMWGRIYAVDVISNGPGYSGLAVLAHGYNFEPRTNEPAWRNIVGYAADLRGQVDIRSIEISRRDGLPDNCGNPPPLPWKDWPQEKRDAAVQLISPSDWQAYIPYLPKVGPLNPGDTINGPVFPPG